MKQRQSEPNLHNDSAFEVRKIGRTFREESIPHGIAIRQHDKSNGGAGNRLKKEQIRKRRPERDCQFRG
jgi:hypothetical protein